MKQRDTPTCPSWRQQLLVFASYLVHRRLAQGPSPGVLPFAAAGWAAIASTAANATAAVARDLKATRRSAAERVECIDGHLRVRRAVSDAGCVGTSPFVCWAAARGHSGPS